MPIARTVERLRYVDANLRVSRWTADGDIWISSGFQRAESVSDNEDCSAEATKRLV